MLDGDDERVRWRYQATGLPAEHQLRVYGRGADPTAPDEIVANVWGWSPEWRVTWVEDGSPRGEMSRRRGKDPLSVELHEGADKPKRREWVEPTATDHLFYARVGEGTKQVVVEVKDSEGRMYREAITLSRCGGTEFRAGGGSGLSGDD